MTLPQDFSVLLLEDEAIIAMDTMRLLKVMGATSCRHAGNAEEALAAARNESFDLILADIMLGDGMDGIQTMEIIRSRYDTPVVFITANADPATRGRAMLVRPEGYLTKPLNPEMLREAVASALSAVALV